MFTSNNSPHQGTFLFFSVESIVGMCPKPVHCILAENRQMALFSSAMNHFPHVVHVNNSSKNKKPIKR